MKTILFIYMNGCPYCRKAREVLAELFAAHPEYKDIPMEEVDETVNPEKLKGRNYYYVPTFFYGDDKIYEAHTGDTKEKMEQILGEFYSKVK